MFLLHGHRDDQLWYGDGTVALSVGTLKRANLTGSTVFVSNCYLPESPWLEALLDVGASAVVGGHEENWSGVGGMLGSDILGMYFRYFMESGHGPKIALLLAKVRMLLRWPSSANADTLAFRLWEAH